MNDRPLRGIGVIAALGAILVVGSIPAEAGESERILIRNVRLVDRSGEAEDRVVNILIKGSKLNLVTEDEVEPKEGLKILDADGGVLLGTLQPGETANFLILDQDPRENIEALLDTKTHAVFAIREGEILKNMLAPAAVAPPEATKRPRWIAYSPPPMALPVNYLDAEKWNRWETKAFSGIFIAAVAADRQRWLTQDDASEQQVGDLKSYNGGEIRAFRLGIAGTFNFARPWFYQFIIATKAFDKGFDSTEDDDFLWLDYRVDIPVSKKLSLSVGKQKEPISMERLLLGTQMPMTERPAVLDSLFRFRNVGVRLNGGAFERRVSWAVGVFNDWFDESQSLSDSSTQIIGRAAGLAWVNSDESHLLHLGLGVRYDDAREDLRYGSTPEFNLAPLFVDTGVFDANRTLTTDLEVSWRRGPIWISGEFIRTEVDAPHLGDPVFGGFHVSATWLLTGEMRPYNRRNGTIGPAPVSRTVYQGGPGAWEIAARYSSVDLTDGSIAGGEMDVYSLGLNWSLTSTFIINLNYRHVVLNRFGIRGHSDGLMYRLILMLE